MRTRGLSASRQPGLPLAAVMSVNQCLPLFPADVLIHWAGTAGSPVELAQRDHLQARVMKRTTKSLYRANQ